MQCNKYTDVENYGYDEEGVPNELTGDLLWPDEVMPEEQDDESTE